LYQDEIQKGDWYVDPNGTASDSGLQSSDVEAVFCEIRGHYHV
jgi:hypothetical protein